MTVNTPYYVYDYLPNLGLVFYLSAAITNVSSIILADIRTASYRRW